MLTPTPPLLTWRSLSAYAWLQTPVWLLDVEHARMLWANQAALDLFHAASMEELLERDFSQTDVVTLLQAPRPHAEESLALAINRKPVQLQDGCLGMLHEARPAAADSAEEQPRRDAEAEDSASTQRHSEATQPIAASMDLQREAMADITQVRFTERRLHVENRLLGLIASGKPLQQVLKKLVQSIEDLSHGMLCSIVLLDAGNCLRVAAAPSLPAEYFRAIDGLIVADAPGPCAAAIRDRQPMFVSDIGQDPVWGDTRHLLLAHGLRACWSVPIQSAEGCVLGAFAAYYMQPRTPLAEELELLETVRHIASVAIERVHAREQITQRERQLNAVLDSVPAMMCYADLDGRFVDVNQRYAGWLGAAREVLIGKHVSEVVDAETYRVIEPHVGRVLSGQEVRYERRQRTGDGQLRDFEVHYVPHLDTGGKIAGFFVMLTDITERKHDEERLYFLANHDHLTSLPNRNLFSEHVALAIAQAARNGNKVAALFLDLDRFKTVNDTLGHQTGDGLLQEVARRLRGCLRESDVIARLGGDEYVIMLRPVREPQEAAACAQKLLDVLSTLFAFDNHELYVTGSIGISIYPDDAADGTALLKNADTAMYRAKQQGKNTYQFFSRETTAMNLERLRLETRLRRALDREEFLLHYQPIVDLRSDRITGLETLIRWQHPERGMVLPNEFIPLAEETGLITTIGQWVLEQACRQCKTLQQLGFHDLQVAVNLSPRQFREPNLVNCVARALDQVGLHPACLQLEVTEGSVMEDADSAIGTLHELKQMGVRLSIDDFGTGYSSLSYLKRFPIDALKIDRSFVQDIPSDQDDAAITSLVIAMGHSLRLTVIAEGVETREQLAFLRERACQKVQGYLFSRPVSVDKLTATLNGTWSR